MEKPNLAFFPYSIESLSISSDPKPEPVPPPNEWKTTKPDICTKKEKNHHVFQKKKYNYIRETQYLVIQSTDQLVFEFCPC